jgi:hypothetical protein
MKSQHTPGPWRTTGLNVRAGDALICFATDHWFSEDDGFYAFTDPAEKQANARLISSAPDLLVALENLLGDWERVHGPVPEDHEARAAIAKAKGL